VVQLCRWPSTACQNRTRSLVPSKPRRSTAVSVSNTSGQLSMFATSSNTRFGGAATRIVCLVVQILSSICLRSLRARLLLALL
jgi:hypothetical protein